MLSDVPSAPRLLVDVFSFVVHAQFEVGVLAPEEFRWKIFLGWGLGATCCACVSFAWEIVRDSPMVNFHSQTMDHVSTSKCALVIGGEVYVARKREMLHDVIGGHQAYIQRKKDLFLKPRISQLAKTTRG